MEVFRITKTKEGQNVQIQDRSDAHHFFDQKGLVHHEFVPEGQTVNQNFYKEVLGRLHDRVRRSRRNLWENHSWLLHHDNAPAHTALSMRQFLASTQVKSRAPTLFARSTSMRDFWLFPRMKAMLNGTYFASVEEIKAAVTRQLRDLKEKDFTECFQGWQKRINKCIDSEGDHFEGDN